MTNKVVSEPNPAQGPVGGIPLEILQNHLAILGKTGAGKTNSGKVVIEEVDLDPDCTICIIDPLKSDWYGLTLAADGRKPGRPFDILGGPFGHVPLHPDAGKALGSIVASGELRRSILDMKHFGPGDHAHFFNSFAESLFREKTRSSGVLYLVIDEAHVFCPKEKLNKGDNAAIYYMKRLATAARSTGVRLIVLTQRTQALHNAVLGSCDGVIAHRLTLPADQKPVIEWLRANAPEQTVSLIAKSMPRLDRGEAWLCSGEMGITKKIKVPLCSTYDNSATPTGKDSAAPRPPAVDHEKLRRILGDALAEAKANDPKALRERVAELEKQLANALAADYSKCEQAVVDARKESYQDGWRVGWSAGVTHERKRIVDTPNAEPIGKAVAPADNGNPSHSASGSSGLGPSVGGHAGVSAGTRPEAVPAAASGSRPVGGSTLGMGERKVLTVIYQHGGATAELITVATGYKRSSRNTYLQRLSHAEMIVREGDRWSITSTGRGALGPELKPLPTGDELRLHWLTSLSGGEQIVLQKLCEAHPHGLSASELDARTDYARSSRNTYIQRLASRELVVRRGGRFYAAAALFSGGTTR